MKKWFLLILASLFFCCTSVWAQGNQDAAAKTVIENWFAAMKAGDVTKAASFLAPQFISLHTDGISRDKAQEIALIKNLDMKSYNLSNFKFSQSGDIIIVTYKEQGQEQIDKTELSSSAAGRMAILQKQGDQWLIIAYANLHPIK